jgi:hypothetical protein
VASGVVATAAVPGTAAATAPCDHACAEELSEDDLEAEAEETELEAEVDIAEGGSVQV